MIQFKNKINSGWLLIVLAAVMFTTSCSKDENDGPASNAPHSNETKVEDKKTKEAIETLAHRAPAISWYNSTMDKIITIDPMDESKSFSFSDPNPGWNFSNSSGVTWQPASGGGGILFVGPGAFGANAGGSGTVVAGNTALNIASTFCFSASEEAIGLDLFDFGGPEFDGISGVIGFAGDLEALTEGEFSEDDDIFDYFQGIAYYVVYDNEASGSYDILNWFENIDEPLDDLGGNGFAWVFGFSPEEFAVYFSKSGSLNVSGGTIGFTGEYFGLVIDGFISDSDDDDDIFNFDFVEVEGFGTMGCN